MLSIHAGNHYRQRTEPNCRNLRPVNKYMTTALFHNFTDKPFTGYWNGRAKTFKPGAQMMMEAYLAEHYAKHLVNQILIERGDFTSTSPKKPEQVPNFMELFKKACIIDESTEDDDESETSTRVLNQRPISSDIDPQPAPKAKKASTIVEDKEPQIIGPAVEDVDDDEDTFEGKDDSDTSSEE